MVPMKYAARILVTVLAGAGASVGCGSGAANEPPPTAATAAGGTSPADDDATAGLMEHHRHHQHGGVTLFIAMSLDTLGVSPEQRTAVEKIRSDLHTQMEPARAAEQSLVLLLADGVAAGTIDQAKVDAAITQLTRAAGAVHDASTEALNRLHAVLTPEQRAALADKVGAHWRVWQEANTDEGGATKPESGHLARVASDLGLTQDQLGKIHANLAERMKTVPHFDPQEVTTRIRAFGDAFRADTFDARALTTARDATPHMVAWGAAHRVCFVEAVSPVLTPDQRATFAQMLREHANHNPSAQGA